MKQKRERDPCTKAHTQRPHFYCSIALAKYLKIVWTEYTATKRTHRNKNITRFCSTRIKIKMHENALRVPNVYLGELHRNFFKCDNFFSIRHVVVSFFCFEFAAFLSMRTGAASICVLVIRVGWCMWCECSVISRLFLFSYRVRCTFSSIFCALFFSRCLKMRSM